jgi:hypothetical protein
VESKKVITVIQHLPHIFQKSRLSSHVHFMHLITFLPLQWTCEGNQDGLLQT